MNFLVGVCLLSFAALVLCGETRDPCQVKYDCDKITETIAYKNCIQSKRIKRQTCPYANSVQPQVVQAIPVAQPTFQEAMQPVFEPVQTICDGAPCGQVIQQPCLAPTCVPTVVTSQNCVNSCTQTCGGNACRDRCQQSCQPSNQFQNSTSVIQKETRESYATSPNVTTIIKLTNIVNNTNVVNVPTNINNTNVNNLDLGTNTTSQQAQRLSQQKCCLVVEPKVCHPLNSTQGGYRCIHRKHHTCGEQCKSPTVHAQVRQPCAGSTTECPPQIAYVPQPQTTCSHQSTWPYVSCGGQNQKTSCGGCYDHYGFGYHNYYGGSPPSCVGCYDDGFQQGSLYRQGPYYQPGYYHTPPVPAPAMPFQMQPNCGGYGCFANQYVDPVFVYPSYSPYSAMPPVQNYGMQPQFYPQLQQYYPQPQQYYPQPQQYYPMNQQPYYGDYYNPVVSQPIVTVNGTSGENNTSYFQNDLLFNQSNATNNNTAPEIIPLPWSQPPQPMYSYPVPIPAPFPASYPISYPAPMPAPFFSPFGMGPISYPSILPYNTIDTVQITNANSTKKD